MNEESPTLREAVGDAITDVVSVEYGDETYKFPASLEDADADVLEAIDDQKLSYALRALLEPEQYARFKATKPKVRDFGGLFDAYAKRIGLDSTGN